MMEEEEQVEGWIEEEESAKEMLERVLRTRPFLLVPPLHRIPLRLGNVVEVVGPSPSAKTQILIQTLHYQHQKQRDTHGVDVDLLMIDSIGAFYWIDRASTSLAVMSNDRKSRSFQSVVESIVQEIRKLLLMHPMLVLATKAASLGDKYSINEAKRNSRKWSSENVLDLRTVKSGPQTLPYREYMPSIWQSFVTHRVLIRASDEDSKHHNCPTYLSEWLLPSLDLQDKFIVTDAGVYTIS